MRRDVDWREISDGRLYTAADLAPADTQGCENCGRCCHGMRDSILLDPYDVYCFAQKLGMPFAEMLGRGEAALGERDGLILPHLCMSGPEDACVFLDEQGRCSVHTARPGFCRLYPLGRYYRHEQRDFRYIFQVDECIRKDLGKIKIRRYLGIPMLPRYEQYILRWHYFLVDLEKWLDECGQPEIRTDICTKLLRLFYFLPYEKAADDAAFYQEFDRRMAQAEQWLDL